MLAAACLGGCSGSKSSAPPPQAALATSEAAQREFRELRRQLIGASPSERLTLRAGLERFIDRHAAEPVTRLARVHLARLYVEQGELERALAVIEPIRRGPAGSAFDFAIITQAAIASARGRPGLALELLMPLDGKIVDPDERLLFGEERVHAAGAAKRWNLLLPFAIAWLSEAPAEEREVVQDAIAGLIDRAPSLEVEKSLAEIDRHDAEIDRHEKTSQSVLSARDWVRKIARERLVRAAIERRDAALAKRLLESGAPGIRMGDTGAALMRLAARGSVAPRVAGRAIGVVLSLYDERAQQRSAQVSAGISRALDLFSREARADEVRLVLQDDGGELEAMESALAMLAGDGAAVLVAGVDEEGASRAAQYAESSSIPVIVLANPKQEPVKANFSFTLGHDANRVLEVLRKAIESRGARTPALVGPGGVACDVQAVAGKTRFPIAKWQTDKIDALLLLGPAACSRDAIAELAAAGLRPMLGLGVESGELFAELETPQARLAVRTGEFPVLPRNAPRELRRWIEATGSPPRWYEMLGHDAALLAAAALRELPIQRLDDAETVARYHQRVRAALARAEAHLWSAARRSFDGNNVLERDFETVFAARQP